LPHDRKVPSYRPELIYLRTLPRERIRRLIRHAPHFDLIAALFAEIHVLDARWLVARTDEDEISAPDVHQCIDGHE
jgi:hypothetical protein